MKRLFLHLIVGLLTFSLGSFLFVASEYYNTGVIVEEAAKREKAEPQRPSASDIEAWKRMLGCVDEPVVMCVYAPVQSEAWPEACQEYRRLLEDLQR